jgi:hypothetical protein
MFDRVMEIVTASPQPTVPGINEIDLAAYDLQGTTPSVTTTEASSNNGAWTASGTNLGYTASSVFDTGTGFDPESLDFYEIIYARCSDGVHQSPAIKTRVLTYRSDSEPSISDGIPDYWMSDNFGTPNGASASGDDDLDTLSNIEEYRSGMNPASAASAQRVSAQANGTVSWQGKAYELYELQGSTNSTDWFQLKTVLATNDTPGVTLDPSAQGVVIYRVLKVP